jgi:alditol oxidase
MAALRNWAGNVAFGAARVHRPESLDELRRVVADSDRVRALGSAHSFNTVADTADDLVRLDGLPQLVRINPAGSSVTVSAGMRYAEVAVEVQRAGYALANLASLPHISVAGSCATGTHGSGDTQRCLAASVAALRLVGPDGDLVDLRRGVDPFPGTVVALGALGVLTEVTLDVEPTFDVAQWVRVGVALDDVAADFDAMTGAAYSVSLFTDWASGTGRVWLKHRVDQPAPEWRGGRPADGQEHPVPGMEPRFCTEQGGVPGPWHERLPHFRPDFQPSAGDELQSEFYVGRDRAAEAFAALRGIGHLVAPVLHIAEVRTVRADDLWLSGAYGRDSVTFHFTWIADTAAVLPVLASVEERLMPLGARPHWGKLTTVPGPQIIQRYGRGEQFAALMRAFDPGGKFRNPYVDALFPPG